MVVLNEVHFRLLENFLDHVKASGSETESDGFLGEFISSMSLGIEGPVTSAIKVLRTLKDLEMVLYALREAVKNGLSMAQKKLLPVTRHHGILSLPLEIVAHIFRQVYDDDANCATQSIPLVNRYFRDIAIRIPELWTRLTPCRNPRLYIERSKPLGLEVDLSTGRNPDYRPFLEMVAPEAERWTSLSIPSYRKPNNYMRMTHDILSGKTFTALRELRIEGSDQYWSSLWDLDDLYGWWKMPSAALISFHLHVGGHSHSYHSSRAEIDLNGITKSLQSVPSLTELSLDIGWFATVAFRTGREATLPNVKTLRLRVKARGVAYSSFTNFLASLHMPNLSSLSVDVTAYFASLLTDWIGVIFPKENSFWPSLETLDLDMSYKSLDYNSSDEYERDGTGTSAPDDLLKRLPAVRHLVIRAVNVGPPDAYDLNVQLPHLRTLSFRDCNEFETRFIKGIKGIFEAPEFETLRIHNCKKIDTGLVREGMPAGKRFVSNQDISVL